MIGFGDQIADQAIVPGPRIPANLGIGCQCRFRDARDDRHFRLQMLAGRGAMADRRMDMAETILDRHRLRPTSLHILFAAAQAGE